MFAQSIVVALASAAIANAASNSFRPGSSLHRRTGDQVAIACNTVNNQCACPTDLNGDSGVLINYFPGYQCAYAGGACSWSNVDGSLFNTAQTNCPTSAPCYLSGCKCPVDNNGDGGVLINQLSGYQCAYAGGACTWDFEGDLQNKAQTNCPTVAKCVKP